MNREIFETPQTLGLASAERMRGLLGNNPEALVCVAAGDTQIPMLGTLAGWTASGRLGARRARVAVLDEWVGLDGNDAGSCSYFLENHFFRPLGIQASRISKLDAKSDNLAAVCESADHWLDQNGPIDLLYLGVGMNGHVGFNEPGAALTSRTHVRKLDVVSVTVGRKYFTEARQLERGITLGLADLVRAKEIIIQITGVHKAEILKEAVSAAEHLNDGLPGEAVPTVAHLLTLPNVTLMADCAAARLL